MITMSHKQDALGRLARALGEETDRSRFLDDVSHCAKVMIGHELFTIMIFDAMAVEVQRIYSSRPDAYPVGGRKQKQDTAWGRLVLEQGKPYIGRTADDIRTHFADHELIIGLGLQSILNVPIRFGGQTLGTMNLLHEADFYSEDDLFDGLLIASLLISWLVTYD